MPTLNFMKDKNHKYKNFIGFTKKKKKLYRLIKKEIVYSSGLVVLAPQSRKRHRFISKTHQNPLFH